MDGDILVVREVEQWLRVAGRLAGCMVDPCAPVEYVLTSSRCGNSGKTGFLFCALWAGILARCSSVWSILITSSSPALPKRRKPSIPQNGDVAHGMEASREAVVVRVSLEFLRAAQHIGNADRVAEVVADLLRIGADAVEAQRRRRASRPLQAIRKDLVRIW